MARTPGTRIGPYEVLAQIGVLSCLLALSLPISAQEVTLDGWVVARPGVRAESGGDVIRLSGGRGWILAKQALVDFVLRLEFRPVTADAEGGVVVRAYPQLTLGDPWVGYRIALPRAGRMEALPITAYEGSVKDVDPATEARSKPVGEWRTLEVRVERDRITVTIDGVVVRNAETSEPGAGHVGLEKRGGVMEFRNARVERLPAGRTCEDAGLGSRFEAAEKPGPGNGVEWPRLRRSVRPRFPPEAMTNHKEGAGGPGASRPC